MSATQAERVPAPAAQPPLWQKILSVVLLIIFGAMSVLTVVSNWSARQIHNTNAYMRTVSPLASDPAIQEDLAARITARIQGQMVNVLPDEVLADRSGLLIAPMRQMVDQWVYSIVLETLQSDQFQTFWDETNRLAHTSVERVLAGVDSDLVSETNGVITLDISPIIQNVLDRLSERGLTVADQITLENIDTTYVLFESEKLGNARRYVAMLDTLRWVFPLIGLIAAGAYLFMCRDRWRGGTWLAVSLALSMTVFLLLVATGRWQYLLRINTDNMTSTVAAAYYDTVTHSLRILARWLVLFSLVGVGLMHICRPGGWARRLNTPAIPGTSTASTALATPIQQTLAWISGNRLAVAGTLVGIACLIIIALDRVTTGWAIVCFLLAAAALGVLITNRSAETPDSPTTAQT